MLTVRPSSQEDAPFILISGARRLASFNSAIEIEARLAADVREGVVAVHQFRGPYTRQERARADASQASM